MPAGFPAFSMGEQREKDDKGETEMEKFFIEGPSRLEGEVVISGAEKCGGGNYSCGFIGRRALCFGEYPKHQRCKYLPADLAGVGRKN